MTASTDQERAEFEAWCDSNEYDRATRLDGSGYNNEKTKRAWAAWQAARRAQVVPQGWKLVPEKPTQAMVAAGGAVVVEVDFGGDQVLWPSEVMKIYAAALAAAPKPPEYNSAEFNGIKTAPVQMPEPVAYLHPDASCATTDHYYKSAGWTALYTEHQVRQLLAEHGVK